MQKHPSSELFLILHLDQHSSPRQKIVSDLVVAISFTKHHQKNHAFSNKDAIKDAKRSIENHAFSNRDAIKDAKRSITNNTL